MAQKIVANEDITGNSLGEITKTRVGSKEALDVVSNNMGAYIIRKDANTTANTTYYGFAAPGSLISTASWKIMQKVVSSTETTYLLADSDSNFDNIWNDRASLSYG